jgi:hypothetical protein
MAGQAQFFGVAGGRALPLDPGRGAPEESRFRHGGYYSLDFGMRAFRFTNLGVHFSSMGSDLELRRGDALGSTADARVTARTVTFEARVRSPFIASVRFFGLGGAGVTRFGLDVKQQSGIPFPGGAPGGVTSAVVTYGAGVERHLRQLLHLRLEVRDYVTPRISEQLYRPGGPWHRFAVMAGINIGL